MKLPSLYLETMDGARDLRDLAANWLVIYCYPGTRRPDHQESHADDRREHRAYRRNKDAFYRRQVCVAALSSQPRPTQSKEWLENEIEHTMLVDPALLLAERLGLPTCAVGEQRCYCRATLVIKEGVIEHAFYPVGRAARNPLQILAWIDVHGW